MNWINKTKYSIYLAIVTMLFYTLVCGLFYFLLNLNSKNAGSTNYNSNLIRATYPNYESENFNYALQIFKEYAAPTSEYKTFIGYRRKEFHGEAVNIDAKGFRQSVNHNIQNSVWFLGGSTMWGTGSDDVRTIPSYFANMTSENVLNLGESGYNSLQELIQVQLLLSNGYLPREVVFYDGVNDGYYFCQNVSEDLIKHAYTSRWSSLASDLENANKRLKERSVLNSEKLLAKILEYYKAPLSYFQTQITEREEKEKQVSNKTINSMKQTKRYLKCDEPEMAKKAATVTLNSWRSAAAILKSKDIPVWFVLQPTATYKPENYFLDHIINHQKQAIINEKDSYKGFYTALKSEFLATCPEHKDCSSFIDLSNLFFGVEDYIFIDTCHVSPNANELIAAELVASLRR